MHIAIAAGIIASIGIIDIIISHLEINAFVSSILTFLLCVFAALCILSMAFRKEEIINDEILKEISLPNQEVEMFKENEILKEIKINNNFYTNIKCENEDNFNKLKIMKKEYRYKWLCISYGKKDEIWVVLE